MTDGQLRASLQPNRLSLIIADLHTTKRLGEQRSTGSSLGGCYGGWRLGGAGEDGSYEATGPQPAAGTHLGWGPVYTDM